MTTESPPRPWQRGRVRAPRPDVIVTSGQPLAQLTIYDDLILLARRDPGKAWTQYPVTADAVAHALAALPRGGGLLPPHTLAAGSVHGQPFLVVWIPPGRRTLRAEARGYTIPLPPLVWAGHAGDYRVFALGAEGLAFPTSPATPLYAAPMPNTYSTGAICWGTSDARPAASAAGLARAWAIFEASYFNSHVQNGKSQAFPNSVLARWETLAEAEAYPLDDLVPVSGTLGWLADGGPWKGGGQ